MNVGFDTNTILSAPSGAATYFLELLPALLEQARDNDQLFVFSADEDDAEPLPWLLRNERLHGVSAPFGEGRLWRNLRFPAVERLTKDRNFDGNLDVCHSLNPPLMPSLAKNRILTLHGIPSEQDEPLSGGLKRSLLQATTIITPSRHLAEELQRRLIESRPRTDADALSQSFKVIPPAVHERYLEPPKGATVEVLCQRFPFLEEPYLLAAGAACEPTRSVPLLAAAYSEACATDDTLPALVFVASEELVESVAAIIEPFRNAPGRLLVMEEIPTEELPALYMGSEFLLHPGLDNTYGYAILEAAAIGVAAIVGTQCGALERLGSSLVVPADNRPTSWCQSILELHRNRDLRLTRIAEAKTRVRTSSWANVAEQHWELYR